MNLGGIVGAQFVALVLLAGIGTAHEPPKHPKMAAALLQIVRATQPQDRPQQPWGPGGSPSITTEGVQVYLDVVEVSEATLASLRALGVTIEVTDAVQRLIQGRVPLDRLEAVADLPSVRFIRLPDYGVPNR
jgi:hypothetical protein